MSRAERSAASATRPPAPSSAVRNASDSWVQAETVSRLRGRTGGVVRAARSRRRLERGCRGRRGWGALVLSDRFQIIPAADHLCARARDGSDMPGVNQAAGGWITCARVRGMDLLDSLEQLMLQRSIVHPWDLGRGQGTRPDGDLPLGGRRRRVVNSRQGGRSRCPGDGGREEPENQG